MNLILVAREEVAADGTVVLSGTRARHAIEVLKVEPGQTLRLGLIDGAVGTGIARDVGASSLTLWCAFDGTVPPRPGVDLLLALPRPKVMRRLWAQLAALGVGRIILTNAARVERNYFDTHVITEACYRPLLLEGLQQARDTRVPLVSVHRQFRKLVEDELDALSDPGLRLVADPGLPAGRLKPAPTTALPTNGPSRVLVAVGPEGGWNAFERELLEAHGFTPFSLGPRILRVDTACLALLSVAHWERARDRE